MNCERFQILFSELARESMMDAGDRSAALQHAAECQNCAVSLEEERSLTASLGSLAVEMRSVTAPPQVEAKVLAAFRERNKSVPVVVPLVSQPRRQRYWVAAIAAALLIAFGLLVVRGRLLNRSEPQRALGQPQYEEPKAPGLEVRDTGKPKEPSTPEIVKVPRKRGGSYGAKSQRPRPVTLPANTLASNASGQDSFEVATDFFPIGYGNMPNLQEGGQLLRVELPREAVARFGLPVNMDRGSRVKADVLVGADGLAQAIRFVH